MKKKYG